MKTGETMIAKWGHTLGGDEYRIYQDILGPLEIPSPELHAGYQAESEHFMLIEDLGADPIDIDPQARHFREAAQQLAQIRRLSATKIAHGILPKRVYRAHYMRERRFIESLERLVLYFEAPRLHVFTNATAIIPRHLQKLYREQPVALVHNDFHAKNLISARGTIVPIDWAGAYLGPDLGDLYVLIAEASDFGLSADSVIKPYVEEMGLVGGPSHDDLCWQVDIRGACWIIGALRWIVDVGVNTLPISRDWIPDLTSALNDTVSRLARC